MLFRSLRCGLEVVFVAPFTGCVFFGFCVVFFFELVFAGEVAALVLTFTSGFDVRHIELDGELPLNTFGGSLGTGRIHGLWHIIEGALQASGRAGSRQVKDVNVSFVGASAPIVTGTTFIFVKEPY